MDSMEERLARWCTLISCTWSCSDSQITCRICKVESLTRPQLHLAIEFTDKHIC